MSVTKRLESNIWKLRWLFIYSAVISGFTGVSYFLYQPYFTLSGLNIAWFGVIFAGFNIISALSSKYSHWLEKKMGPKYSLILLVLLTGSSFLLMGHFIFLFSFTFAFLIQFVKGFSSAMVPLIGWMTDVNTLPAALSLSGFFILVSVFLIFWQLKRIMLMDV